MKESLAIENAGASLRTFRAKIDKSLLRFIRLYTFNTPVKRGCYRLAVATLNLCKYLPENITVPTNDGRTLSADLNTGMQTTVFFLGEYEPAITRIVKTLLPKGGTFLDVGANFGWYATLFAKFAGREGSVHAFEPVPSTFEILRRNFELMGKPDNVFINNIALSDTDGEVTLNVFKGQTTGHASISTHGRDDAVTFRCPMTTLDEYLKENKVKDVNFVKVDIEGAEMSFLKGAETLFRQAVPPIFLMEMALAATKSFGYIPNDIIEFFRSRADYLFYRIDEISCRLIPISGFTPDDMGANVICIPGIQSKDKPVIKEWLNLK